MGKFELGKIRDNRAGVNPPRATVRADPLWEHMDRGVAAGQGEEGTEGFIRYTNRLSQSQGNAEEEKTGAEQGFLSTKFWS